VPVFAAEFLNISVFIIDSAGDNADVSMLVDHVRADVGSRSTQSDTVLINRLTRNGGQFTLNW